MADRVRTIRVPMEEQISKLHATKLQLSIDLDRDPTPAELAKKLELTTGQLRDMFAWSAPLFSFDLPVSDGHGGTEPLSEQLYDPTDFSAHDHAEIAALISGIQSMLDTLTAREARVIAMRFGLADGEPKTLEEIGQEHGVTRERIRQIESKALKQLREPACIQVLCDFIHPHTAEEACPAAA